MNAFVLKVEYPHIVKRPEKSLDYGWAHLLCQETTCSSKPGTCFSVAKTTSIMAAVDWIGQFHWALHHQIAKCTWACPTPPPPPAAYRGENLWMGAGTADGMWVQYILGVFWTKTTQLTSSRGEVGLQFSRRFHHGYSQSFNPKQLSSCPQGSYKIVTGKVQSWYPGYNHCRLHPSFWYSL